MCKIALSYGIFFMTIFMRAFQALKVMPHLWPSGSNKGGSDISKETLHNPLEQDVAKLQANKSLKFEWLPLRGVKVSKEPRLYKEFKFIEFLLYFWLRIEKTLKKCPKLAKYLQNDQFCVSVFNLIQFWLKSRAKIKQIQVLYNFSLHFTPHRAQGAYS